MQSQKWIFQWREFLLSQMNFPFDVVPFGSGTSIGTTSKWFPLESRRFLFLSLITIKKLFPIRHRFFFSKESTSCNQDDDLYSFKKNYFKRTFLKNEDDSTSKKILSLNQKLHFLIEKISFVFQNEIFFACEEIFKRIHPLHSRIHFCVCIEILAWCYQNSKRPPMKVFFMKFKCKSSHFFQTIPFNKLIICLKRKLA